MNAYLHVSRRAFLKAGAALGGGLLIGWGWDSAASLAQAPDTAVRNPFAGWITILPDNRVVVKLPGTEMGQGHATAMPMLVAEELEADWKQMEFALADGGPQYVNPMTHMQSTTGSMAVRGFSEPLRKVGAAARMMLVAAAAEQWGVPAAECRAELGRVLHPASGKAATFGQLAEGASHQPLPQAVALKQPREWKLLGKPTRRLDSAAHATGKAVFGQDVRVPGMGFGAIAQSPVFGGKLRHVDPAPALASKGVKAVVPIQGGIPTRDDAVVVVADTTWHAFQGLRALKIEWDAGPHAALGDAGLWAAYRAALDEPGETVLDEGGARKAIEGSAQRLQAQYEVPYLAHAALEPLNATASYQADGIEIWVPTQASGLIQAAVSQAFSLPLDRVKVHVTFVGGGFGRRGDVDYAFPAVWASKAVGAPVQVVWSREEDMRHDSYRPAAAVRMEAGLDAQGRVTGIAIKHTSSSIAARLAPAMLRRGPDFLAQMGFADSPYEFPARKLDYVMKNLPVPVGFWRSVASSYTGFAMESFVDALAHAAGQDPIAFRLALLKNHPRHAAVLERLARETQWDTPLPAGQARGLALYDYHGTIAGEVVEVSLRGHALKIHRIVAVVDCGLVVNPLSADAQVRGGIVFGLTAALFGEVNVAGGAVQQGNYRDYPLLRMAQTPPIDVHFISSEVPHNGLGEPGVPPIAPALTNALFALTGKRIATLPLAKQGYSLA
jgi:isoquinoline 1-oxidoreductase beta subunit